MEYQYIVNPKTNRKCSIFSKQGQKILENYVQNGSGMMSYLKEKKDKIKRKACILDCADTSEDIEALSALIFQNQEDVAIWPIEMSFDRAESEGKLLQARIGCRCAQRQNQGMATGMGEHIGKTFKATQEHDTIKGSNYMTVEIVNQDELQEYDSRFNHLKVNKYGWPEALITVHPGNTKNVRFTFTLKNGDKFHYLISSYGWKKRARRGFLSKKDVSKGMNCDSWCDPNKARELKSNYIAERKEWRQSEKNKFCKSMFNNSIRPYEWNYMSNKQLASIPWKNSHKCNNWCKDNDDVRLDGNPVSSCSEYQKNKKLKYKINDVIKEKDLKTGIREYLKENRKLSDKKLNELYN